MLGGRRAGRAVPRSAAQLTAVLAEVADGLAAGELFVNKPVDRVNEAIQSGLHRHPFPYLVRPSHLAALLDAPAVYRTPVGTGKPRRAAISAPSSSNCARLPEGNLRRYDSNHQHEPPLRDSHAGAYTTPANR